MKKSGGSDKAFNSLPGRTKGLAQYERVQTIHIQDQERNLEPWRERVHPWTTVRVSFLFALIHQSHLLQFRKSFNF